MPILRQMPKLYLRGSLANITMADLTEPERNKLDDVIKYVCSHPEMAKHKAQIIKQFGVTIGGDYASDNTTAESEYQIAIWRGAVSLFYHAEYSFKCNICESLSYKTTRGKNKSIDRKHVVCPSCNCSMLDGLPINYEIYRKRLEKENLAPLASPIDAVPGDKKYTNPDEVLKDPKQLKKFFGEFAWNYFRQHLKENKRQEHKKTPKLISGRAHYVIAEELASVCSMMGIEFNKILVDEQYCFHILAMQTPPEFSVEFAKLNKKANQYSVSISIDHNNIIVSAIGHVEDIEALVIKPEHVSFMDNQQCIADEDNNSTLDQVDYRFVEGQKIMSEDHVAMVEMNDVVHEIRRALPHGMCRDVYDILCQKGNIYNEFSDKFGVGEPRINHIAEYLGITTRLVNDHKEKIKVICLSHGLTP